MVTKGENFMSDKEIHNVVKEAVKALDAWFDTHNRVSISFGVFYTCNKYRIRTIHVDDSCVELVVYLLDRSIQYNDVVKNEDVICFKYEINTKTIKKL